MENKHNCLVLTGKNMSNQNALSTAARLRAKLPYPLHPLVDLAFNLWWSWSFERLSIFSSIESQAWEQYHHNPLFLTND